MKVLIFIVLDIVPGFSVRPGLNACDPMNGTVIQPVILGPASQLAVTVCIGIGNGDFRQEFGGRDAGKRRIILNPHLLQPPGIHISTKDTVPERGVPGGGNLDRFVDVDQVVAHPGMHNDALIGRIFIYADRVLRHAHQVDIFELSKFRLEGRESETGQSQSAKFEKITT